MKWQKKYQILFQALIIKLNNSIAEPFYSRSRFYWAGWSIAKYQHYRGLSFYELNKIVSIEQILPLYDTLHEADITKFYMILDEIVFNHKKESNLKIIRTAAGLSQSELSKKADVSIRNIQMYHIKVKFVQ